jgi:hypothetical protein
MMEGWSASGRRAVEWKGGSLRESGLNCRWNRQLEAYAQWNGISEKELEVARERQSKEQGQSVTVNGQYGSNGASEG